jgi:hypothetical membrane protein
MISLEEIIKIRRLSSTHLCVLCGIICIIIFFTSIAISIFCSSWFSWTDNYISELAGTLGERPIWSARGIASVILNIGLILTGVSGIIFSKLIKQNLTLDSKLGNIGFIILSIDMFAFIGVGIFPATLGIIHVIFSYILLGLAPFTLFFIGYQIGKLFGKKIWWVSNILSIISLFSVGVFLFIPSLVGYRKAIAEIVILTSIFVLFSIICIRLVRQNSFLQKNKSI